MCVKDARCSSNEPVRMAEHQLRSIISFRRRSKNLASLHQLPDILGEVWSVQWYFQITSFQVNIFKAAITSHFCRMSSHFCKSPELLVIARQNPVHKVWRILPAVAQQQPQNLSSNHKTSAATTKPQQQPQNLSSNHKTSAATTKKVV